MSVQKITPPSPARPRLALVLGSGGVRSIAAVGIADRLAREGIHPDLIVGCSSGALFGATIACGTESDGQRSTGGQSRNAFGVRWTKCRRRRNDLV